MESDAVSEDDETRVNALTKECGDQPNKALFTACAQGRQEVATYLIRHLGADVNNREDSCGRSPLHAAVSHGHHHVAQLLAKEFGADVAVACKKGETVLHVAAERGDVEAVRVLVAELGTSMEARTMQGSTPLHYAVRGKRTDVVRTLATMGADMQARAGGLKEWCMAIHIAVRIDCREMVLTLVNEFGADVNARADDGRTPLHVAVAFDLLEMARLLVRLGADVEARDCDDKTPFYIAFQYGAFGQSFGVARFLSEEAGADIEATCTGKDLEFTPLHMAATLDNNETALRALVTEFGAAVDTKDTNGNTPLHLAASYGHHENVDELLTYLLWSLRRRQEQHGMDSAPLRRQQRKRRSYSKLD